MQLHDIHQIWHPFSSKDMPPAWSRFSRTWRERHPNVRLRLWGPNDSREFVATHYPGFLRVYDGYRQPIQRVDSLRILLLHHFGGLYVDLDVECLRNVEPLLQGCDVVIPAEPAVQSELWRHKGYATVLSTAFLASEPKHPFWLEVVEELRHGARLGDGTNATSSVLDSTGPFVVTRCYERWADKPAIAVKAPELIYPVDERECTSGRAYDLEYWLQATGKAYAVHHWASTWNRPGESFRAARRPYAEGVPLKLKHPDLGATPPGQLVSSGPLVSCIMVTRGWSHPARWAIQCYLRQSYRNRELVVVTTNDAGDIERYLEALDEPSIRFVGVLPEAATLGEQRNFAVDRAKGTFVCTWDDDDLSGADRIAAGVTAMMSSGAAAAFLERITIWWPGRRTLAVSARHHWENTMIARKELLPRYLSIDKAEDSELVKALVSRHPVAVIDDPNLYCYTVTGGNTWSADHFQRFFENASFRASQADHERALSVLDKHYPVLEYLEWMRQRDPKSFREAEPAVAEASATPLPASKPLRTVVSAAMQQLQPMQDVPLTIMMAWELGGGLGHTMPLAQVAEPLLQARHQVHMVLLDLSSAGAALGLLARHPRLSLWQAPRWNSRLTAAAEPATYAELLFRAGYLDARGLHGLIEGWASLLKVLQPDLLLAAHAPTALLAARGLPIKTALIDTGFFIPPRQSPMPSFREWEPVPLSRVAQSEELLVKVCNEALAARGQPQLDELKDLLACDETFLITVPELDHFTTRSSDEARYCGPLAPATQGQAADWPAGTAPALFVYLKSEYGPLGLVLDVLKSLPLRVLAYIPGLSTASVVDHSTANLRIVVDPVDMEEVCGTASAVLCQSGSGTIATALHAGKPLILLPMYMEQLLLARRVQNIGAGLYVLADRAAQVGQAILRVLNQRAYTDAARAFARRNARAERGDVAQQIAARCVDIARETRQADWCSPGRVLDTPAAGTPPLRAVSGG